MTDRRPVHGESGASGVTARPQVVLVPLDGSKFAQRALPVGARLARALGAELHVFRAFSRAGDAAARQAELERVARAYDPSQCSVAVAADAAGAIRRQLETLTGALLCLASHGRGRSAAVVGSVTSEIVGRTADPLVVAGPAIDEVAPWVGATTRPEGVVACVDETPSSGRLVKVARHWAGLLGEPLAVATVAEPVPPPVSGRPARRRFGPEGDADEFLRSLVASAVGDGAEITTVVLWDPISPAEGLRRYLREHPAALVVAGSRARQGLVRAVFGSVAAGIVHASPSPVLVVPPPAS